MPSDLTPTRLRELIAAATPGPWTMDVSLSYDSESIELTVSIPEISKTRILTEAQLSDWENQVPNLRLLEALVNNAPALADALAKVKIYEEALVAIDRGRGGCEETHCWNVAEQALIRAAKEAADAK